MSIDQGNNWGFLSVHPLGWWLYTGHTLETFLTTFHFTNITRLRSDIHTAVECFSGENETVEVAAQREPKVPILGRLPTAETGYDMLNLSQECTTVEVSVFVCFCIAFVLIWPQVFFFFFLSSFQWAQAQMGRNVLDFTSQKYPQLRVWVLRNESSDTHHTHTHSLATFILVYDPHTRSQTLTQMWTPASGCEHSALNTGVFVQVLCA